jgi:hypothetical protein
MPGAALTATYLGDEMTALVRQAAAAETITLSAYVRRAVVERLRRDGLVQLDPPEHPRQAVKVRTRRNRR